MAHLNIWCNVYLVQVKLDVQVGVGEDAVQEVQHRQEATEVAQVVRHLTYVYMLPT